MVCKCVFTATTPTYSSTLLMPLLLGTWVSGCPCVIMCVGESMCRRVCVYASVCVCVCVRVLLRLLFAQLH